MTQITSSPFSTTTPMTFARGRNGDVYGVNGRERGFRWDTITSTVEQLGISAPTAAPTVTASTADFRYYLAGIDVTDGGYGYRKEPTIRIGGGGVAALSITASSSTDTFTSTAHGLSNGTIVQLEGLTGGLGLSTHQSYYVINASTNTFQLSYSPGGSAVNFAADVSAGTLRAPPPSSGVTKAIVQNGRITGVKILQYGIGYVAAPTVTCDAPDLTSNPGTGASLTAVTSSYVVDSVTYYTVTDVTVNSGGTGYFGRPRISFGGPGAGGATAEAITDGNGSISDVVVYSGGEYTAAPTVSITPDWSNSPRAASLTPVLKPAIKGKYWCAIRYVDDTAEARGGPIPSSISPLAEVEVLSESGSFSWTLPTTGIEARVAKVELWRTTADQVSVLYKVAEVTKGTASYTDTLSDAELASPDRTGFEVLPITLPNGQVNARRFNPPPQNKSVIAIFQDRAWYGVDVPGRTFTGTSDSTAAEPNVIYFSEQDEPESVPEFNQLIIQENVKGQDRITALMPFGGGMVVFQERHSYRLSFASQPLIDANIMLIGQRGCLNQRCWDVYDGVAYVVDSMGMYMLDGNNAVPLSDAVDPFWSDNIIHFASSKWFFVRVDPVTRIARFFFSVSAGMPDRALCFHPLTKAWWVEQYAQTFAAMECMATGGRQAVIAGGQAGKFYRFDYGNSDINASGDATGIACTVRTGFFPFQDHPSRAIRVLYKPTTADCDLSLALHYNGLSSSRPSAVRTDRGTGFTTDIGGDAKLNLKRDRSALGQATGYAVCSYVGRMDDKSSGGDRHLGAALSVTRPSTEGVTLYGLGIEGVGE